jgi:hypothetical protein
VKLFEPTTKNWSISFDINEEAGEAELCLSGRGSIDNSLSLEWILITFQSKKDNFMKNGNFHITLNRCVEAIHMFLYDYREFVYILESLDQDSMDEINKEQYWRSRSSVGYIFEKTSKEIKRKMWIRLKTEYIYDHPEHNISFQII